MVRVRTIEKTGGGGVVVCVLSRLLYLCLFIFCVVGDLGFDAVSREFKASIGLVIVVKSSYVYE